ncbi:MAG: molybdopterin molybdotransferase MoeA [Actinobacteria bacterium]|nr:molybdopterin molybdotransferase MoeA [Actinomycetota bacterium]
MITYKEALEEVLRRATPKFAIKKYLIDAVNLVLAEDIVSSENVPFSDNSAMDGFAVRFEDIKGASKEKPAILDLIGEVPAGKSLSGQISAGEAVSIFTGAVIPEGADTVVEIEVTEVKDGKVYVYEEREIGANIRRKGEDLKAGEIVFSKGTLITPSVVGVLASIGKASVKVFKPLTVAIISTGSELIDIGDKMKVGLVRNSNTYLLEAHLKEIPSLKVLNYGVVSDDISSLEEVFEDASMSADLILSTGGVSLGDYDLVKLVLEKLGFKQVFWKVAQKPGKPLAFYEKNGKVAFGLPGNPAAVHICFLEYVRPYLLKSLGYQKWSPIVLKAKLMDSHSKKKGRLNFLRVFLEEKNGEIWARKAGKQGSGVLSTSARSNAIALIPAEREFVEPGEIVEVHYFSNNGW